MTRVQAARALVESRGFGCLSTNSARHAGFPFVSIAEYALDETGQPIFLLSGLAVHTKNIAGNPRASLIVFAPDAENDVLGSARVTLMGIMKKVAEGETEKAAAIRARYLDRHPESRQWADFGDFAFFFLEVIDVYYVGGFGEMGWVGGGEYGGPAAS